MAPQRLQNQISYIDVLSKAKPKQRQAILKHADKELVLCLCECVLNVLNGNVPLKPHEIEKLRKHQNILRHLVEPKNSLKNRKEIFIQKGGFLPVLLAPILGIAGQLLADAIIKK